MAALLSRWWIDSRHPQSLLLLTLTLWSVPTLQHSVAPPAYRPLTRESSREDRRKDNRTAFDGFKQARIAIAGEDDTHPQLWLLITRQLYRLYRELPTTRRRGNGEQRHMCPAPVQAWYISSANALWAATVADQAGKLKESENKKRRKSRTETDCEAAGMRPMNN